MRNSQKEMEMFNLGKGGHRQDEVLKGRCVKERLEVFSLILGPSWDRSWFQHLTQGLSFLPKRSWT